MTAFLVRPPTPSVHFGAIWVVRAGLAPLTADVDAPEEELRWRLAPGLREDGSVGIVGDLVVSDESAFGGMTVFGQLGWDDMPAFDANNDDHWLFADALIEGLAGWATHTLYDYAAHMLNALLVGAPYELLAPWSTPETVIQTSEEVRGVK